MDLRLPERVYAATGKELKDESIVHLERARPDELQLGKN